MPDIFKSFSFLLFFFVLFEFSSGKRNSVANSRYFTSEFRTCSCGYLWLLQGRLNLRFSVRKATRATNFPSRCFIHMWNIYGDEGDAVKRLRRRKRGGGVGVQVLSHTDSRKAGVCLVYSLANDSSPSNVNWPSFTALSRWLGITCLSLLFSSLYLYSSCFPSLGSPENIFMCIFSSTAYFLSAQRTWILRCKEE